MACLVVRSGESGTSVGAVYGAFRRAAYTYTLAGSIAAALIEDPAILVLDEVGCTVLCTVPRMPLTVAWPATASRQAVWIAPTRKA